MTDRGHRLGAGPAGLATWAALQALLLPAAPVLGIR